MERHVHEQGTTLCSPEMPCFSQSGSGCAVNVLNIGLTVITYQLGMGHQDRWLTLCNGLPLMLKKHRFTVAGLITLMIFDCRGYFIAQR